MRDIRSRVTATRQPVHRSTVLSGVTDNGPSAATGHQCGMTRDWRNGQGPPHSDAGAVGLARIPSVRRHGGVTSWDEDCSINYPPSSLQEIFSAWIRSIGHQPEDRSILNGSRVHSRDWGTKFPADRTSRERDSSTWVDKLKISSKRGLIWWSHSETMR